jgi:CHAT domain-containing protein
MSGEMAVGSAVIATVKQRFEYLIVSIKEGKEHRRYVIPSLLFISAVEQLLPSSSLSISSFLQLNHQQGDRCIDKLQDSLTDSETKEIISRIYLLQGFLILVYKNEVIGIIDPQREIPRHSRKYTLRKLNIKITYSASISYNILIELSEKYSSKGDESTAKFYIDKVDLYHSEDIMDSPTVKDVFPERKHVSYASYRAPEPMLASKPISSPLARLLQKPSFLKYLKRPAPDRIVLSTASVIERRPYIEFSEVMAIDEITELVIGITGDSSTSERARMIGNKMKIIGNKLKLIGNKSLGFTTLVVSVVLDEPRLLELVNDSNAAIIHVPIESIDPRPTRFSLKANKTGHQIVRIQFYDPQQQMYIEELTLRIQIVMTKESKQFNSSRYYLSNTRETDVSTQVDKRSASDFTLEIRENKEGGHYRFDFYILSSNTDDKYYPRKYIASLPLKQEPEKEIRGIIRDIERMIKYPQDLEESLSNKGLNLYEFLFPTVVKDMYWDIKNKIKSIHIFSDEPWIPWEILKPWKDTDGGDYFLCEQYSFTRWPIRPYNNYVQYANHGFQINKAEVVIPSNTKLANTKKEYDLISGFGIKNGFIVNENKSMDKLLNVLDSGNFELLHISAHGKYDHDDPLLSYISIEDGRADFKAESIVGPRITQTFKKTNPIVFLNACQSGSQGHFLTGIGGWAQQFIKVGASAFIGTLWSVSDTEACQFTERLYSQLSEPIKLSEAVQKTRTASRNPGDVSHLAYVLFAPPNLSVNFSHKNEK